MKLRTTSKMQSQEDQQEMQSQEDQQGITVNKRTSHKYNKRVFKKVK
jgi:hypothetical protein